MGGTVFDLSCAVNVNSMEINAELLGSIKGMSRAQLMRLAAELEENARIVRMAALLLSSEQQHSSHPEFSEFQHPRMFQGN